MNNDDRVNRTWLCCVVFTDIVGYSKQSTHAQLEIKQVFNAYVSDALKSVTPGDWVLLDTGDGAAFCVSDPEQALFSCLAMQSAFAQDKSVPNFKLEVRIGVNLGSVKLIKDLNGNLNAVGDGINVAQRVMSFAGPNQILVARSFFEVASSLSDEYARLFAYEGVRTDKHVKEHSVYSLVTPGQVVLPANEPETIAVLTPNFPPDAIAGLEQKLAHVMGPIARVLVKNEAKKAKDWDALVAALAAQLSTAREKSDFLAACRSLRPS